MTYAKSQKRLEYTFPLTQVNCSALCIEYASFTLILQLTWPHHSPTEAFHSKVLEYHHLLGEIAPVPIERKKGCH